MRIIAHLVGVAVWLIASGCVTPYQRPTSLDANADGAEVADNVAPPDGRPEADQQAVPGGAAAPLPAEGPTPRAATTTEFGVRTVRLEYGLPGRPVAPTLISFQQIRIVDGAGRPCPVVSTNWGKAADYWAGISFTAPADAQTISADFVLSLDNVDYPLTATLTRIDATHWRVDYGVVKP